MTAKFTAQTTLPLTEWYCITATMHTHTPDETSVPHNIKSDEKGM
jgi:hypothetical protein